MIAINKADGNNIEKSNLAKVHLKNALHLFHTPDSGWLPKIETCSATEHINIDKIWKMIIDYKNFTLNNGYFEHKRTTQNKYWMYETINEHLKNNFYICTIKK